MSTPLQSSGFLVADIINLALRQIGVGALGTTAQPEDITDGVMHLNMMLGQWQRRRWVVPNLIDRSFSSTGKQVYTLGPGGDLQCDVRPAQIKSAYTRKIQNRHNYVIGDFDHRDFMADFFIDDVCDIEDPFPLDYHLQEIPSFEDYSSIALKTLTSYPGLYHYNPSFPFGEFRPWPIQPSGWEYHVLFATPLPAQLKTLDRINLPPEYQDAIMWALAARLAPSYGQEASATVVANAKIALDTLRLANTQIPSMSLPSVLQSHNKTFWWSGL